MRPVRYQDFSNVKSGKVLLWRLAEPLRAEAEPLFWQCFHRRQCLSHTGSVGTEFFDGLLSHFHDALVVLGGEREIV